jgi:hypothetical protein
MSKFSEIILIIGGVFHLAFAVFHMYFWKLFRWKEDLEKLFWVNRAVMQILNLCLTYLFIVFGVLSIVYRQEMVSTNLGNALLVSIAVFWILRMIQQLIFFGLKSMQSIVLTILLILGGLLYLTPLFL